VRPGEDVAAEILGLLVKSLGRDWEELTRPRMRNVTELVRSSEPLKSNTFIASHKDFFSIPAARPSFLGIVK
jgi:hypothetical protein